MDFKQIFRNKWLLVIGMIGIACLLFGSFWNQGTRTAKPAATGVSQPTGDGAERTPGESNISSQSDPTFAYEDFYSKELTGILSGIAGIHNVSVMVTVDSTGDLQIANNTQRTQTTSNGSSSANSVTTQTDVYSQRNSDGSQTPFVTKTLTPSVRGVLVTVNADDFYLAKQEIIDAIEHVLDVPAYKISVEPKQDNP